MNAEATVHIDRPRDEVWRVITDIEHASETISGIEQVEILERPPGGLVGLKWVETRTMFGKTATETMWITEAEENRFYRTRAENHGAVYVSTLQLNDAEGGTELIMRFGAEPSTLGARILGATLGRLFAGATRKALLKDLEDNKRAVEARAAP